MRKLSIALWIFIFSSNGYSEVTRPEVIENVFLTRANDSCYFCSLPRPNNKIDIQKICGSDPYKVVCDNYRNDKATDSKLRKKILDTIREGQKKSLKSLGYNDLAGAVKDLLNKAGIRYDENSLQFKNAVKNGNPHQLYAALKGVNECFDASSSLPYSSTYAVNDEQRLSVKNESLKNLKDVRSILNNQRDYLNNLRSQNISAFYEEFANRCMEAKANSFSSEKGHSLYRKFRSDCGKLNSMEAKVVDWYRHSPGPGTSQQIKEFIREYSYIDTLPGGADYSGPTNGLQNELSTVVYNLDKEEANLTSICGVMSNYESGVAEKVFADLLVKVQTNKVFVDHVFDSLYSQSEVAAFRSTVETAKASTLAALPKIFPGSINLQSVRNSVSKIEIETPRGPTEDLYTQTKEGTFLDETKLTGSPHHNGLASLFDPALYSLKGFNAFYMPSMGKFTEHVSPVGSILQKNVTNPFNVFTVFAHEFGHHFDANLVYLNGLPLKKEYENILACYRKNTSIKMPESQKGEVTADYISATVVAQELAKVPAAERTNVYIESLKDFCLFSEGQNNLDLGHSSHPHSRLRVNGIYTAHPEIRKVLGCPKNEEYRYEICP